MSTADEVFETWEEMEASGVLDRKLNALQLNTLESLEEKPTAKVASTNTNGRMIILGDDAMRSQYVPPRPTVKILKRPQRDATRGNGDGPLANGDKPKQPIKSLKQREQEYAEARKRILGEEKSPEEKLPHEINKIHQKFNSQCLSQSSSSSPSQSNNTNANTVIIDNIDSNSSSNINNTNNSQNRVLRMPLGPDGTHGFNVRR